MGAWLDSILVRSEDFVLVERAVREVARAIDCKFLIGPPVEGWISVFPSEFYQGADQIAAKTGCDVFHLVVADDDTFNYHFYRRGEEMDRYVSRPDEESDADAAGTIGEPELFADLLPAPDTLAKVKRLLDRENDFIFENERLIKFADLLCLRNAFGSYDYLQGGETDEIEGWEKFVHIEEEPDPAARRQKNLLENVHTLEDFNRFIASNPDFADAYFGRGMLKKFTGDKTGALADFDKAIELKPDWIDAYTMRADTRTETKDFTGAIADYGKIISLKPGADFLLLRSKLKRDTGDTAGELSDLEHALVLDPASAPAFNNRGRVKREAKDWDGAIADYERAIALDPRNGDYYNNRGLAKASKGDFAGAMADYDRAIELNPATVSAFNNRGQLKRSRGDWAGAIADCDIAIQRDPGSANHYANRAEAKRGKGDTAGALADFNTALGLKPDSATLHNNRGELKRATGDFAGALEDYAKALELDPRHAATYNNRGELKRTKGDLDGAIADFDKALECNPAYATSLNNRANAKTAKKDFEGALADYNKAIEISPRTFQFYGNRAGLKRVQGEWDNAISDYDTALALKPDWLECLNARGETKRGKGDFDGALADYDRVLQLKPGLAMVHNNRGMAKRGKGDLEGALADFKRALEIKSDFADARKNFDEAIIAFNELKKRSAASRAPREGIAKIPPTENTLVLRTDFSDEAKWKSLCEAIQDPDAEFNANVEFVSDRQYDSVTAEQLPALMAEGVQAACAFIVDRRALTEPEHPILVVDLMEQPGKSFRVIASALWEVENNISIGNMGFDEFAGAVDEDGIYRGIM